MKLAVVCPIGPLDRFGYQYTYATALESYSLFADVIYLVCSSRIDAHIQDVKKHFPKAVFISNEQTWYSLDEAGQETFDIYQWDHNLQTGLTKAQQDGLDAAVVVPINAYIPEKAIPLIQAKIKRMLEEDRPYEIIYRRYQLASRLFVPDAGLPNVINLRLPETYRVRYDWTEAPDGTRIPISYNGLYPQARREAFVDCGLEMTVEDMRDKFSFTKSYRQLNPNAPQQFDFQVHVTDYYLPKFLNKTITRDALDRFGKKNAQKSSGDFVSDFIIRRYLSPSRRIMQVFKYFQKNISKSIMLLKKKIKNNQHG